MAKFAIVRADGSVDQVDGLSVQDVSDQYGWPGNGTIEEWDAGTHGTPANVFASPAEQRAAWEKIAAAEQAAAAGTDEEDLSSKSRADLNALATELGVEDAEDLPNKAAVIDAINEKKG